MSCPLHPHNIYLEVIINTGIIGIIIFLIFLLNIFINLIKFYLKKNNSEKITLISTLFIAIFVSELWPLRSYGSIFQTVNGSAFWYLIALLSSIKYLRTN
jgi:O-antigen ligase